MAILHENTTTGAWGDTSPTLTKPTRSGGGAAAIGDMLIAWIHTTASPPTAPNLTNIGFTFIAMSQAVSAQNDVGGRVECWGRQVQAGEAASYVFNTNTLSQVSSLALFSGTRMGAAIGTSSGGSDVDGTVNTVIVPSPSGAAEAGGMLMMGFSAGAGVGISNSSEVSSVTGRTTEIYDINSTSLYGAKRLGCLSLQSNMPAGAPGDRTFTLSTNALLKAGLLVLLVPAEVAILPEDARLTRLSGAYTDIDDDPSNPDASWLTVN